MPARTMHTCDCFCILLKILDYWFFFFVQVDQMVIHSASDPRPRTTLCGDYFYNYFTRGLDILFDGQVLDVFLYIHLVFLMMIHVDLLSFIVLEVPRLFCRLIKSRSSFCTLTSRVMLILTHTSSAIS